MRLNRWAAGLAGPLLAVSLPTLVAQGDTAHRLVSSVAALSLMAACALWGYHGLQRSTTVEKGAGLVVAGGLLLAATLFFIAIGAAVAAIAGAIFGLPVLARGGAQWRKFQAIILLATAVGVAVILGIGGIARESTFWVSTLVFSTGMGLATTMFVMAPLSVNPQKDQAKAAGSTAHRSGS